MERKLPIMDIAGTAFYVDVLKEELRQTDVPGNRISFNELKENKNGYSLLYDIQKKNTPEPDADLEKNKRYVRATLPALMELDPEGLSRKYGIPLEGLSPDFPYKSGRVTAKITPLHRAERNTKK